MNIINETKYKINQITLNKDLLKINSIISELCKIKFNLDYTIIFVSENKIQELNKKYSNKNKSTDVLSFKATDFYNDYQGDILICYKIAKSQQHFENFDEILFLSIHGILHLLNYDHVKIIERKIMFNLQKKIIVNFNVL